MFNTKVIRVIYPENAPEDEALLLLFPPLVLMFSAQSVSPFSPLVAIVDAVLANSTKKKMKQTNSEQSRLALPKNLIARLSVQTSQRGVVSEACSRWFCARRN